MGHLVLYLKQWKYWHAMCARGIFPPSRHAIIIVDIVIIMKLAIRSSHRKRVFILLWQSLSGKTVTFVIDGPGLCSIFLLWAYSALNFSPVLIIWKRHKDCRLGTKLVCSWSYKLVHCLNWPRCTGIYFQKVLTQSARHTEALES